MALRASVGSKKQPNGFSEPKSSAVPTAIITPAYTTTQIIVDLPRPPSLNRLWRFGRGRTKSGKPWMYPSREYIAWKRNADKHWLLAKPKIPIKYILGPFKTEVILAQGSHRIDQDNLLKALLDFAQKIEIIENDSLNQETLIRYGEAPLGVRLIIKRIDKEN